MSSFPFTGLPPVTRAASPRRECEQALNASSRLHSKRHYCLHRSMNARTLPNAFRRSDSRIPSCGGRSFHTKTSVELRIFTAPDEYRFRADRFRADEPKGGEAALRYETGSWLVRGRTCIAGRNLHTADSQARAAGKFISLLQNSPNRKSRSDRSTLFHPYGWCRNGMTNCGHDFQIRFTKSDLVPDDKKKVRMTDRSRVAAERDFP
jgi:hypothetical protein